MPNFNAFEVPVKKELSNFKIYYKNTLKSKTKILDILANYIHHQKGNRLLPLLTLLSAKITGRITEDTFVAASIVDHLYTATQIHDDVEDESFSSNIFQKLNDLWKEKLSVLMGDYFLAKGLILSVNNKTYDILEIVSKSVKEITEAELSRIYYDRQLISSNNYLEIINQKSSIFSACTTSGALSGGANKDSINTISSFGRNFGIAYYIKEELNFQNSIVKSKYRATLPFILSIENSSESDKVKLLRYLEYPKDKELTKYFQNFTEVKGGLEKSIKIMHDYKLKALNDITEFPYSLEVQTIKDLINQTID